jgi:hypothetical protein
MVAALYIQGGLGVESALSLLKCKYHLVAHPLSLHSHRGRTRAKRTSQTRSIRTETNEEQNRVGSLLTSSSSEVPRPLLIPTPYIPRTRLSHPRPCPSDTDSRTRNPPIPHRARRSIPKSVLHHRVRCCGRWRSSVEGRRSCSSYRQLSSSLVVRHRLLSLREVLGLSLRLLHTLLLLQLLLLLRRLLMLLLSNRVGLRGILLRSRERLLLSLGNLLTRRRQYWYERRRAG